MSECGFVNKVDTVTDIVTDNSVLQYSIICHQVLCNACQVIKLSCSQVPTVCGPNLFFRCMA